MTRPGRPAPSPRVAPAPDRSPGRLRRGFTLVEVLIVVVILAILAATVLPQFQNASGQAEEASVKQNLHVVRSQIELYRVQHNDKLPGADETQTTFDAQMLETTDRKGGTGTEYGPYIKAGFPSNPAAGDSEKADKIFFATGAAPETMPTEDEGWWYSANTGEFRALGDAAYWKL